MTFQRGREFVAFRLMTAIGVRFQGDRTLKPESMVQGELGYRSRLRNGATMPASASGSAPA